MCSGHSAQQQSERTCRRCGCTQDEACQHDLMGPCWWVAPDLCSHCDHDTILEQEIPCEHPDCTECAVVACRLHDGQPPAVAYYYCTEHFGHYGFCACGEHLGSCGVCQCGGEQSNDLYELLISWSQGLLDIQQIAQSFFTSFHLN